MEPQLRGRFRPVLPCAAGLSHESIFVRIAPSVFFDLNHGHLTLAIIMA